jgi:hypothetical protein
VEVNHMRLWEKILWILDKVFNGGQMWESLHAKFAIEPAAESVEDLIFLLSTVPDYSSLAWGDSFVMGCETHHSTGAYHQL